jgi:hypothetical protein
MSQLINLLDRFAEGGFVKAGELLLPPDDAIRLARALAEINVPIIGVDVWYWVGMSIAENPNGLDFSPMLGQPAAPLETMRRAVTFIEAQLPPDTAFVSFVIDDEGWWKRRL